MTERSEGWYFMVGVVAVSVAVVAVAALITYASVENTKTEALHQLEEQQVRPTKIWEKERSK